MKLCNLFRQRPVGFEALLHQRLPKVLYLELCIVKRLSPKNFVLALYCIILLLLAANTTVIYSDIILNRSSSFSSAFYFDRRYNIPFFFSLSLTIISLILLFRISRNKHLSKSQSIFWKTLLIAFFLFTLDETFYIHQHFKMSTFGRIASYDPASWTHYLWVIPYFFVFGILVAILVKYSSSISTRVRKKLLKAATVFLLGAVLMEFAGTYYAVIRPGLDIYLLTIKTIEGVMQMAGAVMFIELFLSLQSRTTT
jgi:uncharacterized membrane protein